MPSQPDRQFDAIVQARHGDPFSILGMHSADGQIVVRTFQPQASAVDLVERKSGKSVAALDRIHADGLFEARLARRRKPFSYRLRLDGPGGSSEIEDPYAFPAGARRNGRAPAGGRLAPQRLREARRPSPGRRRDIGNGIRGLGPPSAQRVSVVGDFNDWDGRRHPMRLRHACGIWEIFLPEIEAGARYKFEIVGPDGALMAAEGRSLRLLCRAAAAHRVGGARPAPARLERRRLDGPARRSAIPAMRRSPSMRCIWAPGAGWRRRACATCPTGNWPTSWFPYVKDMGFYPYRVAAGQRVPLRRLMGAISRSASTRRPARFGDPADFQAFVERCHAEGLGVLLDWGAGAFPDRPARSRLLRRQPPLRTRRPAPGLPHGLEHPDLQLRPLGSLQLPGQQRALLDGPVPPGRHPGRCGCVDVVPGLQPQTRAMGAEPLWRARESGSPSTS